MEIKNASTTPSKYNQLRNVNTVRWEPGNVTTQPWEAKEKYRGMFETQKSGNKTSSGEIGLDIKTHISPKAGQDQVFGRVSVLCWHATPVAYFFYENLAHPDSMDALAQCWFMVGRLADGWRWFCYVGPT